MSDNKIELKPIKDLLKMKFFIPSYQRGYRWTKQQVTDLLNDIFDFIKKQRSEALEKDSFYCIQPLVVKESVDNEEEFKSHIATLVTPKWADYKNVVQKHTRWEVIDGQQRLTTIYILLSYLESEEKYSIEYSTRKNSKCFLENIKSCECKWDEKCEQIDCKCCSDGSCRLKCGYHSDGPICKGFEKIEIDYYHMVVAQATIKKWFEENHTCDRELFKETLLSKVKFIWYESIDENPISVFSRLNIGKIGLTNAELIKALLLNRSNFKTDDYNHIRLKQQEIASEWDRIEYTLQNDEFWLFLHDTNYKKPTRIEFIFDIVAEEKIREKQIKTIGNDKYRTFRYFYEFFKDNSNDKPISKIEECWNQVKQIFQIFEEWFNDLELYHYVGYLIETPPKKGSKVKSINDLLENWKETKNQFVDFLKNEIKTRIQDCTNLNQQYEIVGCPKTVCRPILLLHNIQSVINQNQNFESNANYQLGIFYKFPFHLFKIEGWDVEHIDSNTTNNIDDDADAQKEYALNLYNGVDTEQQQLIKDFIAGINAINWNQIKCLSAQNANNALSDEDKNKIWNFTLLDSSTNRSYGNAIFSAKRRIIIGKDKGELVPFPKLKQKDGKTFLDTGDTKKKAQSAFIPPCTKNIFMKYYSSASANPNYWDRTDAKSYKDDILKTLKDFGVYDDSNDKEETV